MALDRSSIEKRDFPVKRRGYDPEAVAAHLAMLAEEVDALRRSTHERRPESLADAASGQVRLIVDAAERGAAELRGEAEIERSRILGEADREAGEHLERVAQSTASMLKQADALEEEFQALLTLVRTSATRLARELRALEELESAPPPPPDDEGARLIALNMALNGTPREAAERYLADHFDAIEIDGLLDDVYVRAGR